MRALTLAALLLAACSNAPAEPEARAIYVNQLGFAPASNKIAKAHSERHEPQRWIVHSAAGEIVMEGRTIPLGFSERAGQSLHRIEFGALSEPGSYTLSIGETVSPDFEIATGLYGPLANDALAYFYHNRAGEPVLAEHVGEALARPAGHTNEVVTCFKGTDNWGTEWPGCDYELDVTGGWYDAGDHGKYVVNAGISTWTLMDAHEQFGDSLRTPDGLSALDEARKNIEWMLSMQVPAGQSAWVAQGQQEEGKPLKLTRIEDAGGLVHHKVHDESWQGDGVMPHENDKTRYLYPPSTGATANLGAVAARCARMWEGIDEAFAERCKIAAVAVTAKIFTVLDTSTALDDPVMKDVGPSIRAMMEGTKDKTILAYNNFDGGGPYGDSDSYDTWNWMAAEYRRMLIGEQVIAMSASGDFDTVDLPVPNFNQSDALRAITLSQRLSDEDARKSPEAKSIIALADRHLEQTATEPTHVPYSSDEYEWGSNGHLANLGMVLGHAYLLTGERKYRDGVLDLMDYLLGRNPMGISYITGYGDAPFENPHHRHWAHSVRDGAPKPPPGVLSGGPNNTNMSDPVAKEMVGSCAAQTCYADDYGAWTLNEVTINWNAPLVWMAAFLAETEGAD